jgi:RNA polymerase sigma-70 factor, ECF subfamily
MHSDNSRGSEENRTVLGSIINCHSSKWLRFILAILKNEADAEDVFQEAVQRVLLRNRSLPSPEQMKMYLGRAIGNAALELYHSRKRERMRHIPIKEHLLPHANALNPHACLEERERSRTRDRMLQLLEEGLAHLPQKQQEALRLTILDARGQSIRDVGMNSGIPYSTLRHRSKQGLRMMRKFLLRRMKEKNSESRIQNPE